MSALNKVKYKQFLNQARGVEIDELQVRRVDKGKVVLLQYHATSRKGRQRLNGIWSISREGKEEPEIVDAIKEFLTQARKDFFVKRGEGLEGDALADTTQEVESKTIVADDKE